MANLVTILSRSLAAKLIIALVSLVMVGVGVSWYTLISNARKNLIQEAVKDASSSSDLIKKSIRYDMLTFDRQAIQRTLDDLRSAKDIEGIRLFDGSGRIHYSSKRDEIGLRVDRNALACRGCHAGDDGSAGTLTGAGRWTTYQGAAGHTVLTFTDPIYNEPSCSQAACHVHPPSSRVLGILESDISLAPVDRNIREQTKNATVYAFALIAVISLLLAAVLRKLVLKPVATLSNAMVQVAEGRLGQTVAPSSPDEVGRLVRSFNTMTQELKTARERMEHWTESLEREVARKSEELKRSQDRLIQAEKLAALGRLTADVAHEIRNPLTAIGGFARRLRKSAAGGPETERAEVIVEEVARLEKILRDVLTFSRDARSHLEKQSVEEFIFDVLNVYDQAFSEQAVTVEVRLEKDLPPVLIDRDQVRQAFINLLSNALDAMPRGGALTVTAESEEIHGVRFVCVRLSDTGEGIEESNMRLIFEPFFTTKEAGRGTGLGLSITRKIIEEHGGFLRAESARGKGSVFSLCFPQQGVTESQGPKCWEHMKCGRDRDATAKCPAYPNFGRICWAVAGTFCEGKVQGTFAQKYEDCRKCDFYQMVRKVRAL